MQEHQGRKRHGPTSRAHASTSRRLVSVVRRRTTAGHRSLCVSSACVSLACTPRSLLGWRTRAPRGVHALAAASYLPAAHAHRCRHRTRALMHQVCLALKRATSARVGYKRVPPIPPACEHSRPPIRHCCRRRELAPQQAPAAGQPILALP
jgi:hypothetical protein